MHRRITIPEMHNSRVTVPENSQQSNSAGNGQENNATSPSVSATNNATPPSVSATNNATSPSVPTASNNTGNASADFVNSILAVHNRERAAVGVQPLVWNNTLAAGAKAWAENLRRQASSNTRLAAEPSGIMVRTLQALIRPRGYPPLGVD